MMNGNSREQNLEILSQDVPNKFRQIQKVGENVLNERHDFYDYLVDATNEEVVPTGMLELLVRHLNNLKQKLCVFAKHIIFPESLKEKKFEEVCRDA